MDEILKQEMQKELTTRILPYWMERMVDQRTVDFTDASPDRRN